MTETTQKGTTQQAILAGGCFWGMQDLIRRQPGVVSTRVGYTGGQNANATYRNHPGHAEAIEITFDPSQDELPRPAGVLLPDPRPDHAQPPGQRRRHLVPVGDLLRRRRAEAGRRGHHRRRRRVGAVAGQGRHRGDAGGPVLGGRAGAPGLPRAHPLGLHLPLPAAGLEAPPPRRHRIGHADDDTVTRVRLDAARDLPEHGPSGVDRRRLEMGRDVEHVVFTREDRRQFRDKHRRCLDVLAQMLARVAVRLRAAADRHGDRAQPRRRPGRAREPQRARCSNWSPTRRSRPRWASSTSRSTCAPRGIAGRRPRPSSSRAVRSSLNCADERARDRRRAPRHDRDPADAHAAARAHRRR